MGVNTKLACSSRLAWGLQHLAATVVQLVEAPEWHASQTASQTAEQGDGSAATEAVRCTAPWGAAALERVDKRHAQRHREW